MISRRAVLGGALALPVIAAVGREDEAEAADVPQQRSLFEVFRDDLALHAWQQIERFPHGQEFLAVIAEVVYPLVIESRDQVYGVLHGVSPLPPPHAHLFIASGGAEYLYHFRSLDLFDVEIVRDGGKSMSFIWGIRPMSDDAWLSRRFVPINYY